jgi:hypothetical protein
VRAQANNFYDARLMGRPVEAWSDAELRGFLEAWRIGAVAVWSASARARFAALGLAREELAGGFHVFTTGIRGGLAEGARASARPGAIEVRDAAGPRTLLRWNHDPRLRTIPELEMRRAPSPHNPMGFIEVVNGGARAFRVVLD